MHGKKKDREGKSTAKFGVLKMIRNAVIHPMEKNVNYIAEK
jgi:hypothetical protein